MPSSVDEWLPQRHLATAALLSEVTRNVLTLLAVGLTIWFCLGALVAQLFGAFVHGGGSLGKMRTTFQGRAEAGRSRPAACTRARCQAIVRLIAI